MGPKTKGKKKGDGKKKKTAEPAAPLEPEVIMEEGTKQFYMNQIQSLRKKVYELQEECDRYSIAQQANYDRLETLKEIRLGSRAYLGREMDEINYKIKELNVQLKELDDLKEAERVDFNKQIHDLRTKDLQEMREKNESENHMLRSKLNSLDELKQKKESLLAEISRLDEELKQQEHDYREDIYHREKSAVLEKDKLRKDMLASVNDLSSEFRRVSKMQVVQTTRQIILDNVRLNNQMALIETDYTTVEGHNGKIRDQKKSQSLECSLLEEREKMMAKKNRKTSQLIEKLTDECTTNEQFIANMEEKLASFSDARQLIDELEHVNGKTLERRDHLVEENEFLRGNISQQEKLLYDSDHEMNRAQHVVDRTILALHDVVQGSSNTFSTGRIIDSRLRAFENILQLLNVATQLGVGPQLNELTARNTGEPAMSTAIDDRHISSPTPPLGALRRLKTKSVGIQTNISNRNPLPYHLASDPSMSPLSPSSTMKKRRPSELSH